MTEREQSITDASDIIEQNEMLIARELLKDDPNLEYIGTLIEFNVNYARKIRELNSASEQMFKQHKDIYMKVDPPQDRGKLVMRELIKCLNDPEYLTHKMESNMPNVPSNYEDIPEECYTKGIVYDKDKYPFPIEKNFGDKTEPNENGIVETFILLTDEKHTPSNIKCSFKDEIRGTHQNIFCINSLLEAITPFKKLRFFLTIDEIDTNDYTLAIKINIHSDSGDSNVKLWFENNESNKDVIQDFKKFLFLNYGSYYEQEDE